MASCRKFAAELNICLPALVACHCNPCSCQPFCKVSIEATSLRQLSPRKGSASLQDQGFKFIVPFIQIDYGLPQHHDKIPIYPVFYLSLWKEGLKERLRKAKLISPGNPQNTRNVSRRLIHTHSKFHPLRISFPTFPYTSGVLHPGSSNKEKSVEGKRLGLWLSRWTGYAWQVHVY